MRVTDDMVERAIDDWVLRSAKALGHRPLNAKETVFGMLTAALADVPEPDMRLLQTVHEGIVIAKNHAERIAELEAKLARVREALVEHSPTKALAILDQSREEG